jgi:hypothetical protein
MSSQKSDGQQSIRSLKITECEQNRKRKDNDSQQEGRSASNPGTKLISFVF